MTVLYLSTKPMPNSKTVGIPLEIIQDIFLTSTEVRTESDRDSKKKSI